jgi:hypothetical protein
VTITVVTHTQRKSKWFNKCVESVHRALPYDGNHVVIECKNESDYAQSRWDSLHLDKYVAFVDDDDYVYPDAINQCVKALDETGMGIAFTDQAIVDEHGLQIYLHNDRVRPSSVVMTPQAIHHLAVVRSSCLTDEPLRKALEIGIGIDWLCKAYVALKHGAVHVPITGYAWRYYQGQDSKLKEEQFKNALPKLRAANREWHTNNKPFQVYSPVVTPTA